MLISNRIIAALAKALGGSGVGKVEKMMSVWHAGKMFYTLSTWGLALAGYLSLCPSLPPFLSIKGQVCLLHYCLFTSHFRPSVELKK